MTERNDELRARIRALREEQPYRPMADIARELGITRERVRVLLVDMGLPTVVRYEPPKKRGGRRG